MTSLSEVYNGATGAEGPPKRLYLGVTLFVVGALLVIGGIVAGTTDVLRMPNGSFVFARRMGGILAGIGVPAVFLGISAVLPAGRRTRIAAVVGACISVLGVVLFDYAYPCQWVGSNCGQGLVDLTLPTVGLYFLGAITTFWCLFVGVANFKTRNNPGGTVKMEVTRQGETKIIEVPAEQAKGLGGIGFLGETPDGDVETQTNQSDESTSGRSKPNRGGSRKQSADRSRSRNRGRGRGTPASDGGASSTQIRSPMDDTTDDGAEVVSNGPDTIPNRGDAYCGSCAHFDYVDAGGEMKPYCAYHDELMDDMTACGDWSPRRKQ